MVSKPAQLGCSEHHCQGKPETHLEPSCTPHQANAQFHKIQAREYRPAYLTGGLSSNATEASEVNEGCNADKEPTNLLSKIVGNEPTKSASLLDAIVQNWHRLSQTEQERCTQIAMGSASAKALQHGQKNKYSVHKTVSGRHRGGKKGHSKQGTQSGPGGKKKDVDVQDRDSDNNKLGEVGRQQDVPKLTFRADDCEMVEAFLYTRFMQIQQSSAKVIAKAWIKAICPKKQAHYPYVDCNPRPDQPRRRPMHAGAPRVPTFWPDLKLCRHKEPDHLDKNERTHLLVHLIRLKWRQPDWEKSNGVACDVPESVRSGAWVRFLQDVFPPDKLVDTPGCTTAKVVQRVQYLRDIYRVAIAEQEFRQDAHDGESVFTFMDNTKLIHPRDAPPRSSRKANANQRPRLQETEPNASPALTSSVRPAVAVETCPERCPDLIASTNEALMTSDHRMDVEMTLEDGKIQASPWSTMNSAAKLISPTTPTIPVFDADTAMEGLCSQGENPGHLSVYSSDSSGSGCSNAAWAETFPPYTPCPMANIRDSNMPLLDSSNVAYQQDIVPLSTMPILQYFAAPGHSLYGQDMKMCPSPLDAMNPRYTDFPLQGLQHNETSTATDAVYDSGLQAFDYGYSPQGAFYDGSGCSNMIEPLLMCPGFLPI